MLTERAEVSVKVRQGRAGQDIDGKHVQAERNEARFKLPRRSRAYGILRLSTPFVRTAEGKGRFLNVICLCCQISQI